LITVDGAGATLDLVEHITKLSSAPGRRVHYTTSDSPCWPHHNFKIRNGGEDHQMPGREHSLQAPLMIKAKDLAEPAICTRRRPCSITTST
jgi:hypothetical protein